MAGGDGRGAVGTHRVLALVVAHDGAEWLPRTLAALAGQVRPADELVGIDSGSADDSAALLAGAIGTVARVGSREGLAAALHAGVAAAGPEWASPRGGAAPVSWYWIVHDDSAPEPRCLAELLTEADRDLGAAVLIPKSVDWTDPGLLVGVGHPWAPGKPVVEVVDAGEPDQGQYDFEVPAHSGDSACMLVRADTWAALDGFDGQAGTWASAADFCRRVWGSGGRVVFVPGAVTAHRRAGHWGLRVSAREQLHPRRSARAGELYLDLTQAPGLALPWRVLRAVVSTVLRVLALLLTREPEESAAELRGAWDVLGHPGRVRRGRRRARRPPVVDLTRPPDLRAHRGLVTSRAFENWRSTMLRAWRPSGGRRVAVASRVVVLVAVLALAALARDPGPLLGSGQIRGGGLLPAPGAMSLLADYLNSWHDVRFGSPDAQPAYLAVLAGLSAPVLGSVDLVLRLAFTLAVPLAFVSAYASLRDGPDEPYRTSLALGYACLPAGVAAAGAGRISTLALLLLGPVTARWAWTAMRCARDPGVGIRPAIAAGCLLGITASFAPLAWVLAAVVGALGWAWLRFARWPVRSGLVVLGVAGVFVGPWAARAAGHPWLLLTDLGRNDANLTSPDPFVWGLSPGGPGAVAWAGAPLLAAALAGVLIVPSRRALGALAAALGLMLGVAWTTPVVRAWWPDVDPRSLWPGQLLLLAGALLLGLAGSLAAVLVGRLASQPGRAHRAVTAAWLACVAALVVGWWVAPDGPTRVGPASDLPAVVALDAEGPDRPRALVLARSGEEVRYGVSTGPTARLGDADAIAGSGPDAGFPEVVQGLVSGAGGDVEVELGGRGIRYLVFQGDPADPMVAELDAVVGLRRLASSATESLWVVADGPVRAELTGLAGVPDVTVPVLTSPTTIDVVLHPLAELPRRLVVAEDQDPGWRAEVDGRALPLSEDPRGMMQATIEASGRLSLAHDGRRPWVAGLQLLLATSLIVVSLPKRHVTGPGTGTGGSR